MNEFMKENKLIESIDDMCNAFKESQEEVGRLERENAKLKAQLTWHPVSEKLPSVEKDGDTVIAKSKDLDEGLVQFDCVSTVWFINNYGSGYTHWLPIPKE